MHVHTIHSGMCTVPGVRAVCRESYTPPEALYERLKRAGMDLVTVTDHDSIDAVETLRRHPDFFLSEEATCRMPSGTEIHVGVYDLNEAQHIEVQRRRTDVESLAAYLEEQGLFFTVNHVFSSLTGRRELADFALFESLFPGYEALNGHMPSRSNAQSLALAGALHKAVVGGSDAHTLESSGLAWTEVPHARTKVDFLDAVRRGRAQVCGESGGFAKLTLDVFRISAAMVKENPATLLLAPLAALVPVVTASNYVLESIFARRWARKIEQARGGAVLTGTRPAAEPAI